jgi:alpha-tubulin suppressor-like RCC1 family protein
MAFSIVLANNGSFFSFGGNSVFLILILKEGQLGFGESFLSTNIPTLSLSLHSTIQISSGTKYSMVLDSNGYVYSFGNNFVNPIKHNLRRDSLDLVIIIIETFLLLSLH